MQFLKLAFLGLVGLVAAAPASTPKQPRNVALVKQDLALLSSATDSITPLANSYSGTIWDTIKLVVPVSALEARLSNTASDIEDGGALSAADSEAILDALAVIVPKYVKAVAAIQAKASVLNKSGNGQLLHSSLVRIQDNTNFLQTSLTKEIDSSLQAKIGTTLGPVFDALKPAISSLQWI